MKRQISKRLDVWLADSGRKPLVLRGARQVGKTWLVHDLATRSGLRLIELNFERDPLLKRHFGSNDPAKILGELELALGTEIRPAECLLFLDEIQAAGELLAKLRWFHEELPALPVIAAGSLLEFTLADHRFSMPVGRISFGHVEPLGFAEYLEAHGQERLLTALRSWRPTEALSSAAHGKATEWFQRYAMVGGMPAVVAADVAGKPPSACRDLQREIMAAYRADFAKYCGRMDRGILDIVLRAVAGAIGDKFVQARVGEGVKQQQSRRALDLLADARLCHQVRHTAANGLPLGAEVKAGHRKAILADIGLLHALLGTPAAAAFPGWQDLTPLIRGRIADQLVGQQIRLFDCGPGEAPELFYWQREGGRPGEIDYLVPLHGRIVPLELKAGAAGSMKSLHQFMFEKRLGFAARCDSNPPSLMDVSVKTTQGNPATYRLLSLPFSMLWRLPDLIAEAD